MRQSTPLLKRALKSFRNMPTDYSFPQLRRFLCLIRKYGLNYTAIGQKLGFSKSEVECLVLMINETDTQLIPIFLKRRFLKMKRTGLNLKKKSHGLHSLEFYLAFAS